MIAASRNAQATLEQLGIFAWLQAKSEEVCRARVFRQPNRRADGQLKWLFACVKQKATLFWRDRFSPQEGNLYECCHTAEVESAANSNVEDKQTWFRIISNLDDKVAIANNSPTWTMSVL